jgi:hypothetical protein
MVLGAEVSRRSLPRVLAAAAVVLAGFVALPAANSEEATPLAASPFSGGRYDEAERVVHFWSIVPIDWEKVARRNFHRFDIDKPSSTDVNYLRERIWEISGDAELKVRTPVDAAVAGGAYSLISATGILPLKLAALEASISFGFDQSKPPNLVSRKFYGEVVSRRIAKGGGGGIVYRSSGREMPIRIDGSRAEIRQEGEGAKLFYTDAQSRASVDLPRPWHSTFLAAYGLKIAGQRYVFVAWPADTAGFEIFCAHDFALYAVHGTLEQVASSSYDCDV